jgi:hypothetical protein
VVHQILESLALTRVYRARLLDVTQQKVSPLLSTSWTGSGGALMHLMTALEHDVVIEIRPELKKREARVMVMSAA